MSATIPALMTTPDPTEVSRVVNSLVRNFNRQDEIPTIYAADTGTATAYSIGPIPGIQFWTVGQLFVFNAANANTTATPTFTANGLTAGTITYPDGSALVPGDIAANGFYGVICTSTTPTFELTTMPTRGKLIQTVSTETGAVSTGTGTFTLSDTIPTNTAGDQYMSLAITPKSSTSTLIIDVVWCGANSVANNLLAMLFQDSTANALAVAGQLNFVQNLPLSIAFRHKMTSGTTSATTFKVRVGGVNAGTTTFNGAAAGRLFGGVMASSMVIQEVLP